MGTIQLGLRLLTKNLASLVIFEAAYKLLCIAIFAPVLIGLFNLSLFLSGYRYLSEGRLFSYLSRPSTIIILLFILFCITLITILEMSSVIYCFHASYYDRKLSAASMFRHGFDCMRSLLKRSSLLFTVFVIFIIPLTNITVVSGYFSTFRIPNFIMEPILNHTAFLFLFCVFFFFLVLLSIRWCYSIHSFSLENTTFKEAGKRSSHLIRLRYSKTVLMIFIWNISIFVFLLGFCALCTGAYILLQEFLNPGELLYASVLSFFSNAIQTVFSAYSAFSVPVSFAFLSARYYKEYQRMQILPPSFLAPRPLFQKKTASLLLAAAVTAAGAVNLFYFGYVSDIRFMGKQNIISTPSITAHRGDSVNAPENTLSAFQSAIDNGADCIELDVAQTKDGIIVVTHDANLKRLTGKNINIWNITYEELKKLDAGSWFHKKYAGETIPSLSEALELCKGKIQLNIELKPTGHETDYEAGVLAVIEEYRYEDDCIIASKSACSLKKLKELNPGITTIYLMTVAYGNLSEMDFADGFSIESSFISASMVSHIHDAGKSVYAWTVNDEADMSRMLRLGVDSLITDNTIKAKETFYSQNLNQNIVSHLKDLLPSMP